MGIPLITFVRGVRHKLPYLNFVVKEALYHKFIIQNNGEATNICPPNIDRSTILNETNALLLYLSNPQMQQIKMIRLLYDSKVHGESFDDMAQRLRGYRAPILIIVRHLDRVKRKEVKYERDFRDPREDYLGEFAPRMPVDKEDHRKGRKKDERDLEAPSPSVSQHKSYNAKSSVNIFFFFL